jgi:histidinol phosphatase-like enzyme
MGIPLENTTLYTLQFADGQVVSAGDKQDLESMTRKLKETYEKWRLDMNLNKKKYLGIGETHRDLKLDKDSEIEFSQEYKTEIIKWIYFV